MKRFKTLMLALSLAIFSSNIAFAEINLLPKSHKGEIIDLSKLEANCLSDNKINGWSLGLLAFNSAPEIGALVNYLKVKYSIDTAIETGTFHGNTTVFLANIFKDVHTIEVNEETYNFTKPKLEPYKNVQLYLGSSESVLDKILSEPKIKDSTVLFYLDAHWEEYWPILDELKNIAKTHQNRAVILIDDVQVPGRKDIPFDKYKGQPLSYAYIEEEIKKIFTDPQVHYIIPENKLKRAKLLILPSNLR